MKKVRIVIILMLTGVALLIFSLIAFGDNSSFYSDWGKFFSQAENDSVNEIVAKYKENLVSRADIDFHQNMDAISDGSQKKNESDIEIANRIITGFILLEEAEKLGLSATQAEIEEMVPAQKEAYEKDPDTKKLLDEFCNGAGISIEEYFKIVEEQLSPTISRQKLKNHFKETYCKEHNINKDNMTLEDRELIDAAYQTYRDELLSANKEYITYYID